MGSTGQSISEIARAAQQEKEDSEMVRRCLPARIDALLPQEMALCFEHELWQMLLSTAGEASRTTVEASAERWRSAYIALRGGLRCLWEALQGFEARLSARELCVGSDGATVVLGKERRNELQGHFSSDLAELFALAMPSCAKIAQVPESIVQEAEKHLTCVMEAWDAVLTCKTQITDLYMDNDELSKRRLEDLTQDAAKILESEQEILLEEKDAACVRDFLLGASKCLEFPEAWQAILRRLRQDSRLKSTWAKVAGSVLEELKDVGRKEESAARRIQRTWRQHVKSRQELLKSDSCTDAHEKPVGKVPSVPVGKVPSLTVGKVPSLTVGKVPSLTVGKVPSLPVGKTLSQKSDKTLVRSSCKSRSSMFTTRSARWSQAHLLDHRVAWCPNSAAATAPEALSIHLLTEGLSIISMETPTIEAVTQFHRRCTALDALKLEAITSPVEAVAFWLNIRNLSVIIALLQLYIQPVPLKLPNSYEEWMALFFGTSLFVRGRALGPADIDHDILGVGQLSLLPPPSPPSRLSLVSVETQPTKSLMPWPVFGLWLPIAFGSPKLYIFKAETVVEQLRSSAEDFLESCRFDESTNGYPERLELPPTLRSTAATWQPLLKSRGSFSVAFQTRAVDWTFKVEVNMIQRETKSGCSPCCVPALST